MWSGGKVGPMPDSDTSMHIENPVTADPGTRPEAGTKADTGADGNGSSGLIGPLTPYEEARIAGLFRQLDADGDGLLSRNELLQLPELVRAASDGMLATHVGLR